MKINLRKAATFVQALSTQIHQSRNELIEPFAVSIYKDGVDLAVRAEDERRKQLIASTRSHISAMYELRDLIAQANASSGINASLNRLAAIEAQLGVGELIAKCKPTDLEVLGRQIGPMRMASERADSYHQPPQTITVSPWTQATITEVQTLNKSLAKERRKIKDDLLQLNITTEVELSDNIVIALTALDLV